MAKIGSFKVSGNTYKGDIATLTFQAKGVTIIPVTERANDKAPTHRVYLGTSELGAGWLKTSERDREYMSLVLDDPSFVGPIYPMLIEDATNGGHNMVWDRPKPRRG